METGGYEVRKLKLLVKAQDQTAKQLRSDLARQSDKVRNLELQLGLVRKGLVRPLQPAELEQIDRLKAAIVNAESKIDAMENSLSWKITAPLRSIARPLMKG